MAQALIPGGVQHNLAFNYPFPLVFTKAEGAYLYDIDGNGYYDFLQAGGPTLLGSNPPAVREKVIALLNDCGPSTGLFHEYEYKLAKKISESIPTVEMFRMRPEAGFVIHTHQNAASAVSVTGIGRMPTSGREILGTSLPVASYGLPGTKKLRDGVGKALEKCLGKALIMRTKDLTTRIPLRFSCTTLFSLS